ncbi:hypothetical protein [Ruegeria atlantica]|uniref:Uncharacterized protein n=1 Tax=Ruegeria atlantica TaxID=81569 RepID=A0ABX1WEE4_9RHOB|nr:hypothetical protein [Ruegeria atlantica]NOD31660.1 hypothetical protein [Ruegeria atlantica]
MPISPESTLKRIGRAAMSNSDRQERLFKKTGVKVAAQGHATPNYRTVAAVTERMQKVQVDLSALRSKTVTVR